MVKINPEFNKIDKSLKSKSLQELLPQQREKSEIAAELFSNLLTNSTAIGSNKTAIDVQYLQQAIKNNPNHFEKIKNFLKNPQFASKNLKDDKEVVLEAVKKHELALQFASEELKADKNFILAAVNENGMALRYASEEWKNDKDVVNEAVKQDGRALQFASKGLQRDKEVD